MLASYLHTFAGTGLSRSFQGSTSVLVSFSGSQMRDSGVKFGGQELLNIGCYCQTDARTCTKMIMILMITLMIMKTIFRFSQIPTRRDSSG